MPFIVIYNACVLYPAPLRDFLARHPDDFIVDQIGLASGQVVAALQEQVAALKNPPMTRDDVLETEDDGVRGARRSFERRQCDSRAQSSAALLSSSRRPCFTRAQVRPARASSGAEGPSFVSTAGKKLGQLRATRIG